MRLYISKYFLILLLLGCLPVFGQQRVIAQKADTLQPYRDFLSLCTQYQYAPLQLDISYQSGTNLVLNAYDTMTMKGYFYIGKAGEFYLQMGDVEQYINDSICLMINHTLKQAVINMDVKEARKMLIRYLGAITNDTSVKTLANGFRITEDKSAKSIGKYSLDSRGRLPGTETSRQTIALQYNPLNREPLSVVTTRRTIVPIDISDSLAFVKKFGDQGVLVSVPDYGFCFLRSVTATYTYHHIRHEEPARGLPFKVTDYIIRNKEGDYMLTAEKADYRLSTE
jgi:hypothetical protein